MSNENKVRLAHELLDEVNAREDLTPRQVGVLRSFLPKRPEQVTLERVFRRVNAAWANARGNEWLREEEDLETALLGLRNDLRSLVEEGDRASRPAHPEFLETVEDYDNAPQRTIVAIGDADPWVKIGAVWESARWNDRPSGLMADAPRRVLRWGDA